MHKYSVFNRTRQVWVAAYVDAATSCWPRMKGLLGRPPQSFVDGQGLWIEPCQWIHTIGMAFPIDVAYLDANRRIIHLYRKLAPFRIAALKLKAHAVLELPPGVLTRTGTNIADILELRPIDSSVPGSPQNPLEY
jgi:uncharacterized protein